MRSASARSVRSFSAAIAPASRAFFSHDFFDDMANAITAAKRHAPQSITYSKTVTRSFNSVGGIGEERVHEVDGFLGKETNSVTRRLGKRARTVTDVKDLKTGEVKTSHVRREMTDADDADFDAQWTAAASKLPQHLSMGGHTQSEPKQIGNRH